MAEHNFSAAMQMTMSRVVRNYLRWFKRCKEAIGPAPLLPGWRRFWRHSVFPLLADSSAGLTSLPDLLAEEERIEDIDEASNPPGKIPQSILP